MHGDRYLAEKVAVNIEQQLRRDERDVLVEKVLHEHGNSDIVPVSVHEQRPLQVRELGEGIVGAHRGLSTFSAGDAEADVRLLDHRHVVATVAYCRRQRPARCPLHQTNNLGSRR